jgi:uncharacterized protein YjbJ (UPF0337 family)
VKTGVRNAFRTLKNKVTGFANTIKSDIKSDFKTLKDKVTGFASTIKNDVKSDFETLKDKAVGFAEDVESKVDTAFSNLKDAVVGSGGEDSNGGIIGAFVNGVTAPFETLKQTLLGESNNEDSRGLVGRITGGIRDAFSNISQFLNSTFDLSGLQRVFSNVIGNIKTDIENLIEDINELLGIVDNIQIPEIAGFGGGGDESGEVQRNITGVSELTNTAIRSVIKELEAEVDAGGASVADDNDLFALVTELRDRIESGRALDKGVADDVDLTEVRDVDRPSTPGSVTRERPSPLNTGGLIENSGLATLHSGERVIPEAQVTDRGRVRNSGVQIQTLTVNADSRSGGRAAGRALKRELKRFDI